MSPFQKVIKTEGKPMKPEEWKAFFDKVYQDIIKQEEIEGSLPTGEME